MKKAKILVVDDNSGIRAAMQLVLGKAFDLVELAATPTVIPHFLREFRPDVILLDMNFQTSINTGNEGLFWLSEIKRLRPETEVVLFTAYADIALAVEGMKRGAFDFIVKPCDNHKIVTVLKAACDAGGHRKNQPSEKAVQNVAAMQWGRGEQMDNLHRMVERIAPTDVSVLITGENGTGKDVLANEIHRLSKRSLKPMVCVDAGALTETLFESELFGHVKGSFTGAFADHVGKIEKANGTTLFLDEIGNVPLHLQAKLLRVLQNRTVTRVGDTRSIPVDIRLICATNMDIAEMVRQGKFREDLYYRINTMLLHLPSLRERQDEILSLAQRFVAQYAERYHRMVKSISAPAQQLLKACPWKGNIRELQNSIEKAVILSEGEEIKVEDLQLEAPDSAAPLVVQGDETLEMLEERAVRQAVERHRGNLTKVAEALGISRPTLYAKLKKYGI